MACMRSLTIRARFFARQRFTPSVSYVNHHENRKNHHSNENLNSFLQRRSYGVYGNNNNTSLAFRNPQWQQFRHGPVTTSGFLLVRNMSTSIRDVLADKTMEVVSNQAAPLFSEVAFAASHSSLPVAALQYAIDGIHTFTGLNWWASIAITTAIIQILSLPLIITIQRTSRKFHHLLGKHFEIKKKRQVKMSTIEEMERMENILKESGIISPNYHICSLTYCTFVVSYYLAIRNMVKYIPSFETGGASWFLDLTTADSFYILPCLNAYAFWVLGEGYVPAGKVKNVVRIFVALSIPLVASFPQAFFCHWITSNLFSLLYDLLLRQESVRKFLNILPPPPPPLPPAASESEPTSKSKSDSSD